MSGNTKNQINAWLTGRYGTRRGAARTYWFKIRYLMGSYRKNRQINWQSVGRVIFVCRGNICRSAYAEVIARSIGMDSISCGIDTRPGNPANADAIRVAKVRGVNLSEHRATPIQTLDIRDNDLIVAMEPRQVEFIEQEFANKYKCTLLGLWGRPRYPYIQDPYGASDVYFNHCFHYIEKSVHEIAKKINAARKN